MFIKELKITNFKSFEGDIPLISFNMPNGELGRGLNILVGENNTGKSTLFEAIDFLRNGTKKDIEVIKNKNNPTEAKIELTFGGDIQQAIDGFSQDNKKAVFKKYIFENETGKQELKICRSTSDIKQVLLWNEENQEYKNESGIDAPIKKLFETNFVWADTNPNDEAAFGATTICGYLLKEIANSFTTTSDYNDFRDSFNQIFNNDESGLRQELLKIEQRVQHIFSEQFGSAVIRFHFDELKIESFFKSTTIKVDDGINTSMTEKGHGMQRAIVLALLQVYAEELTKHPDNSDITKPFYLFIDEPEICLHPKAQEKLLNALLEISKTKQVFITTHSPYFLASRYLRNVGLYISTKNAISSIIEPANLNPLFPWSPTWAEINFKAYKLPTVELHNELYRYLQEINNQYSESNFDNWLVGKGLTKSKRWTKEKQGTPQQPYDITLQSFIRNKIHHPENTTMQTISYSNAELTQSIQEMINFL